MNITIISSTESPDLGSTKYFGIVLNKALTIIRMLHWYVDDHNIHEILGSLYEDLNDLFDKFQEELIGTSFSENIPLPGFSPFCLDIENIDQFKEDIGSVLEVYNQTAIKIIAMISSQEIGNYIASVQSGLNNTREEIISRFNKTSYLLRGYNKNINS
jgi:DNA-binding ferritin-like protein